MQSCPAARGSFMPLDAFLDTRGAPVKKPSEVWKQFPLLLKVLSIIFAVNFIVTLIVLIFSSRDLVEYSAANLIDWLNLVFEAIALYMFWYKLKVARPFVMGYSAFNIVAGTIAEVMAGTFDPIVQAFSMAFDVFLFVTFWKYQPFVDYFTEEFSWEVEEATGGDYISKRFTWPWIRNCLIYFSVFSFAGHWMEMGFCMAIKAGLVKGEFDPSNTMLWRDWFYPFPMEGMAVVLIALLLYPLWVWLRKKLPLIPAALVSFVVNGILCVSIEFVCGLMWNANLQNWDYSNMPFNFMGQVCLQNGLGFAFAASVIAWVVYPLLERLLNRLPKSVMNVACIVFTSLFLVAQTLYLVDTPVDYRTSIEQQLAEDDANPGTLTPEYRKELEEDLAYLDYLDEYKAENAERIARERAEAAAAEGKGD